MRWLVQNHVVHLTLWSIGRSLGTSGSHVVRSGECTTLRLELDYLLLQWMTFAMTVRFAFDSSSVVATQYVMCLQPCVDCVVEVTRKLSRIIAGAGSLISKKKRLYRTAYILFLCRVFRHWLQWSLKSFLNFKDVGFIKSITKVAIVPVVQPTVPNSVDRELQYGTYFFVIHVSVFRSTTGG